MFHGCCITVLHAMVQVDESLISFQLFLFSYDRPNIYCVENSMNVHICQFCKCKYLVEVAPCKGKGIDRCILGFKSGVKEHNNTIDLISGLYE